MFSIYGNQDKLLPTDFYAALLELSGGPTLLMLNQVIAIISG